MACGLESLLLPESPYPPERVAAGERARVICDSVSDGSMFPGAPGITEKSCVCFVLLLPQLHHNEKCMSRWLPEREYWDQPVIPDGASALEYLCKTLPNPMILGPTRMVNVAPWTTAA